MESNCGFKNKRKGYRYVAKGKDAFKPGFPIWPPSPRRQIVQ